MLLYAALTLLVVWILYFAYTRPPFPTTLLINLDSRPDRLEQVMSAFSAWPSRPERISAIKATPGWKGCTLSHIRCIEIGAERGLPWVLYIEDDCYLTRTGLRQFMDVLPYLWAHRDEWDLFSGGTTMITGHELVSRQPPLFKVSGYASHFILVNGRAYSKILKEVNKDAPPKIDHYYKLNMREWTTVPYIALQKESKSDIEVGVKNYSPMFQKAEKILMASLA